ncbi:hypothetical protein [uncultured Methanobrevibacter sp.]|uniref:hypothetical protein n=1 Tax=uncultured Methanobrevibacter sp. TaxID=253161 RepID=UPI00259334DA|nr:hypothetical protein [uncultured Methanobrevibacter sp.]
MICFIIINCDITCNSLNLATVTRLSDNGWSEATLVIKLVGVVHSKLTMYLALRNLSLSVESLLMIKHE